MHEKEEWNDERDGKIIFGHECRSDKSVCRFGT